MLRAAMVIAFAGCYSPGYRDCQVSCADGTGCPSGLSCETATQVCRLPGQSGACGADDAAVDGTADGSIDASLLCWDGLAPSNFLPCDPSFPAPLHALVVEDGAHVLDTDHGTYDNAAAPGQAFAPGMWLIHVKAFTIPSTATLNVIGNQPLLIVSDTDISLDGVISATAAASQVADCPAIAGTTSSTTTGSGGGGGGLGGSGAAGGTGNAVPLAPPGEGGLAIGAPDLIPLHPGCPGGAGGPTNSSAGGGHGGGAIELASATSIRAKGTIVTGGGGGVAGEGALTGPSVVGGGGGGGAGGEILLEAPTVAMELTSALCALGGGGGEAGQSPSGVEGGPGMPATCTGGTGGSTASNPVAGDGGTGAGGATNAVPGRSAVADSTAGGGGGGGGGVGRIRIHATMLSVKGASSPMWTP